MPAVAALYLNRLKKGMKLEADPTVIFALNDFTNKTSTDKVPVIQFTHIILICIRASPRPHHECHLLMR